MKMYLPVAVFLFVICWVFACKEGFDPKLSARETNSLVIEGVLNSAGPTTITLSRSQPLSNKFAVNPELNATVSIESDANKTFTLTAVNGVSGAYTVPQLPLVSTEKYRIRIKTFGGKEYLSEYVPLKVNPPIDDVVWKREDGGLRIGVNTHDPQNTTRYYRWTSSETWQFHSPYYAVVYIKATPGGSPLTVEDIPLGKYPYNNVCWKSEESGSIWLASTTKQTEDRVAAAPLAFIPKDSWKLSAKYSILVRQYALTKEAFDYWENIKKNSEALGSLFAPQPIETKGNIFAVNDPAEPVIGFFEATNVTEKRIFIDASEVQDWNYQEICQMAKVEASAANLNSLLTGAQLPLMWTNFDKKDTLLAVVNTCIDCGLRGTPTKPSFWP